MIISKMIGDYMGLIIRNSRSKFIYDCTNDQGHVFIREDNKKGFIINDETLNLFLVGKKAKADFKITKGIFWLVKPE
jgi:hypothetical protein